MMRINDERDTATATASKCSYSLSLRFVDFEIRHHFQEIYQTKCSLNIAEIDRSVRFSLHASLLFKWILFYDFSVCCCCLRFCMYVCVCVWLVRSFVIYHATAHKHCTVVHCLRTQSLTWRTKNKWGDFKFVRFWHFTWIYIYTLFDCVPLNNGLIF